MRDTTRVFLVCPGLGHIRRGYESFTQECFDALQGMAGLELELYQGAGPQGGPVHTLPILRRSAAPTQQLARALRREPYHLEQASFLAALLPRLLAGRPDVVYFSDFLLGCWLAHLRRALRLPYRLVFSNGAPNGPPFPLFDRVQQLLPYYHQQALAAGEPPERQVLLPYGIVPLAPATPGERAALRRQLGLPEDRPVLLSVGAINASHKRMDYLVREVASLPPERRPLTVLLGQETAESPAVLAEARARLGEGQLLVRSVSLAEVGDYYRAADVFALASLTEGFGRVLLEAASCGLPVLAHDYPVSREVLGPHGTLADLRQPGALAGLLSALLAQPEPAPAREARARYVRETYGWPVLRERYRDLLVGATAASRGPRGAA